MMHARNNDMNGQEIQKCGFSCISNSWGRNYDMMALGNLEFRLSIFILCISHGCTCGYVHVCLQVYMPLCESVRRDPKPTTSVFLGHFPPDFFKQGFLLDLGLDI